MHAILVIAGLTFGEARRKRVMAAALLLGLAFVALYAAGFKVIYDESLARAARRIGPLATSFGRAQFPSFIALSGLYAANFLGVAMAALLPIDTLAGEIRSGAIQTLVTKPTRREAIVLGKWLGFWVIVTMYVLLLIVGVLASTWLISRTSLSDVLIGAGLMLLEVALVLTISIAGGTRLSTLANGVMVFGLFGLAFVGGWIERIGTLFGNQAAERVGVISSLIMPSEALWQLAAYTMQPPLVRDLGLPLFAAASVPSMWMVVWAVGYTAIGLLLALWLFRTRDL
jgi:ABC-type transport system involved in multi-copper enzyme maturation permease subunit